MINKKDRNMENEKELLASHNRTSFNVRYLSDQISRDKDEIITILEDSILNGSISLESLDGVKKGIFEKLIKNIDNNTKTLLTSAGDLKAIVNKLKNYNYKIIEQAITDLKYNKIVMIEKEEAQDTKKLREDLGIFFLMGGDLSKSTSGLSEFLLTQVKMISDEGLYSSITEFINSNILNPSSGNIPDHDISLKHLDSIKDPKIRKWLNKNTKLAIMNKHIGNDVVIISIIEDENGVNTRRDLFKVPSKYNFDSRIKILDKKELINLLETGIEVGKYGKKNETESKKYYNGLKDHSFIGDIRKHFSDKSSSLIDLKDLLIKNRKFNKFQTWVNEAILHHNSDFIRTPRLIMDYVKCSTTKND